MASPDFVELYGLTAVDLQPPEIYQACVDYARSTFPEFEPRNGSVEEALLQAFSFMSGSYIAAANRIPNTTIEGVLRIFGLIRREAGISTVPVTITLLTPGGTVQAGTEFIYAVEEEGGIAQYPFILPDTITASSTSTTVSATIESLLLGTVPPIPTSTGLIIAQPSSEIFSCVTSGPVSQADPGETEEEFLQRGITYLQSLSRSLNTASQIENYILSVYHPYVSRCKVFDIAFGASFTPDADDVVDINAASPNITLDVPVPTTSNFEKFLDGRSIVAEEGNLWFTTQVLRGDTDFTKATLPSGVVDVSNWNWANNAGEANITITPTTVTSETTCAPISIQMISQLAWSVLATANGSRTRDARGCAAIFIWGIDGKPVEIPDRLIIEADVASKLPIGISSFVYDVMPVDIYVTVQIEVSVGYVQASVFADVEAEIESYFSPSNYPEWTRYIYANEVVAVASRVEGVSRVVDVDLYVPSYGSGSITTTTGSSFFGNSSMATAVGTTSVTMTYAGSMPKVTCVASV